MICRNTVTNMGRISLTRHLHKTSAKQCVRVANGERCVLLRDHCGRGIIAVIFAVVVIRVFV
jgi:hypothetical protein